MAWCYLIRFKKFGSDTLWLNVTFTKTGKMNFTIKTFRKFYYELMEKDTPYHFNTDMQNLWDAPNVVYVWSLSGQLILVAGKWSYD